MAGYHEAKLSELVAHVAEAIDRFRGGELDAFDVDHVLYQYSRAAKELCPGVSQAPTSERR